MPVLAGDPIPVAAEKLTLGAEGRAIVWEAEWPNRMTGTFECLQDKLASGGRAMWVREGTGRNNGGQFREKARNPFVDLGRAEYYFTLKNAGRYRLAMRVWALDQCGNSCWAGIDSMRQLRYFPGGKTGRYGASNYARWPATMMKRWVWVEDETYVYRLAAGAHYLRLDVREDGFGIDQIALIPVGDPFPRGKLTPTQFPSSKPTGIRWSTERASSKRSASATPFDLYFSVSNRLIGNKMEVSGLACFRLNASKTIVVDCEAKGASLKQGQQLRCELSPEKPIAFYPVTFVFPKDAARTGHDLVLKASSTAFPNLVVARRCRVHRPFDWRVSGPMDYREALQLAAKVRAGGKSVLAHGNWRKVENPKHYDDFAAVDLSKVFGKRQHVSAVAVTRIEVKKTGKYRILAGGDDTLQVYAGNKLLAYDRWHQPLTDTIRLYTATLEAGTYYLTAVSEQGERWWQFHVSFEEGERFTTKNVIGLDGGDG